MWIIYTTIYENGVYENWYYGRWNSKAIAIEIAHDLNTKNCDENCFKNICPASAIELLDIQNVPDHVKVEAKGME